MEQHQEFERCIECSECKKPLFTCYTTCSLSGLQRVWMCADCPMLQKKLYAQDSSLSKTSEKETLTGLSCGGCGLTKDEVKMGAPLGCALCYELFQEEIIHNMRELDHLPKNIKEKNGTKCLHIGLRPTSQRQKWDPSVTLVSLQKALQETLQREDYEQAAWIRDKIQTLTKNQNEKKNESTEQPQNS